jgi:hypothetical protein
MRWLVGLLLVGCGSATSRLDASLMSDASAETSDEQQPPDGDDATDEPKVDNAVGASTEDARSDAVDASTEAAPFDAALCCTRIPQIWSSQNQDAGIFYRCLPLLAGETCPDGAP